MMLNFDSMTKEKKRKLTKITSDWRSNKIEALETKKDVNWNYNLIFVIFLDFLKVKEKGQEVRGRVGEDQEGGGGGEYDQTLLNKKF